MRTIFHSGKESEKLEEKGEKGEEGPGGIILAYPVAYPECKNLLLAIKL